MTSAAEKKLRSFIKTFLKENIKNVLGEPDMSADDARDKETSKDEFFKSMNSKEDTDTNLKTGMNDSSFNSDEDLGGDDTDGEDETEIDEINTVASTGLSGPSTPLGTDAQGQNIYDPEKPKS